MLPLLFLAISYIETVWSIDKMVHPLNLPGNCYCGITNGPSSKRIVGGKDTYIAEYPWQAGLSLGTGKPFCGATIVDAQHLITAAHCTKYYTAEKIQVLVGDTDLTDDGEASTQTVDVESIYQHKDYDESSMNNDISVLKLKKPLNLTAAFNVKPACLPELDSAALVGSRAWVTGWGVTNYNGVQADTMQVVELEVLGPKQCGSNTYLPNNIFCAGFMAGGKDACQGDSGGPLVVQDNTGANISHSLLGIVSYGFRCAMKNYPGIYTEVYHHVQTGWIHSAIPELNTCPRVALEDTTTTPPITTPTRPTTTFTGPTTTETPITPGSWKEKYLLLLNKVLDKLSSYWQSFLS